MSSCSLEPDARFKGWMHAVMRVLFVDDYRKIVREQSVADPDRRSYRLGLPRDSGCAASPLRPEVAI